MTKMMEAPKNVGHGGGSGLRTDRKIWFWQFLKSWLNIQRQQSAAPGGRGPGAWRPQPPACDHSTVGLGRLGGRDAQEHSGSVHGAPATCNQGGGPTEDTSICSPKVRPLPVKTPEIPLATDSSLGGGGGDDVL